MGHDILALKKEHPESSESKIAYLRRNAFDPLNKTIYTALKCEQHYCHVSGCGGEQEFSKEDLVNALKSLKGNPELQREIDFIDECLRNVNDNDIVIIHFS